MTKLNTATNIKKRTTQKKELSSDYENINNKQKTLISGCKINLFLRINELLPSGFHTLSSIFYPLDFPNDTLTMTVNQEQKEDIIIQCPNYPGLADDKNILIKAYNIFKQKCLFLKKNVFIPKINLILDKNIPLGAGLGGGSANAAIFLLWLNRSSNIEITQDLSLFYDNKKETLNSLLNNFNETKQTFSLSELSKLSLNLGSDIPFFFLNSPAWAEGQGEHLIPINISLANYTMLLIYPNINICTKWAYTTWDKLQEEQKKNNHFKLDHLNKIKKSEELEKKILTSSRQNYKEFSACFDCLYNSFEEIVFGKFSKLKLIKKELYDYGAELALLSGSGSSIFSLFAEQDKANKAFIYFEPQYPVFRKKLK